MITEKQFIRQIATPAARIHGSGYSSSGRKKSKPYSRIKDEVIPASSRRPNKDLEVPPKTHKKHTFSMGGGPKVDEGSKNGGKLSFGPIDASKQKINFF